MSSLLQDLRYALRQLRRAPGFTSGILLVLGLGIGANAAIFSILNVTLLRRLLFARPAELVTLRGADATGGPAFSGIADLEAWRAQTRTLSGVASYDPAQGWLGVGEALERVSATAISANLFGVLGVEPALGRSPTVDEQHGRRNSVVILSDELWRSRFHADRAVLGTTVSFDGGPATIIGVMPRGFQFPLNDTRPQVWVPAWMPPEALLRDSPESPEGIVGRLRPGASIASATAELSAIQRRLQPLYTDQWATLAASSVVVTSFQASLFAQQRPAFLALLGAVALIWLIASANAANLMLARSSARRREFALRGALGASRARIVRQLLTESLLLSLGGAAVGVALGAATLRLFHHALQAQLHLADVPAFDAPVLAALLGLTVVSAMLFGLAPALLATAMPIEQALRQDGTRSGASRSQHRMQRTLVVTEIALSLTLLVACGLLLRTVFALHKVPLGFRTDHVLLVEPALPAFKYKGTNLSRTLYLPLVERLQGLRGVEAAALTTVAPLEHTFDMNMTLAMWNTDAKADSRGPATLIAAKMRASTADLRKVLGFAVKEGRFFNEQDTAESTPVCLVNEAFERQYKTFQGQSALGHFAMNLSEGREAKVVGILQDFRQAGVDKPASPEIELFLPQLRPGDSFYQPVVQAHTELAIRTSEVPNDFIPELRRVLTEANPDLRSANITTLDQVVEDSLGSQLLAAHLLESLAGVALLVAAAGLYSLLAYVVTLRTREFGLRLALGAGRENILRLVLSQAGVLVVLGVAAGVALSLLTTRLIEHFLFGVRPRDLTTLLLATTTMLGVSLLAAWLPARRAASINPTEALRSE